MDEALRTLERAARASPRDLVAGRAYANALERAGDQRRALVEWARLEREGDLTATARLLELSPWPRGLGPNDTLFHPGPGLGDQLAEERTAFVEGFEAIRVHGASCRSVFASGTAGVVAIDLETLDVRWQRSPPDHHSGVVVGDDLVLYGTESLLVLDGATGETRGTTPLDGEPVFGADRVVVGESVLDLVTTPGARLGAFRPVTWSGVTEHRRAALQRPRRGVTGAMITDVVRGRPVVDDGWHVVVGGWEDEPAAPVPPFDDVEAWDAADIALRTPRGLELRRRLDEAPRWTLNHGQAGLLALAPELVVVIVGEQTGPSLELRAIERERAEIRWTRTVREPSSVRSIVGDSLVLVSGVRVEVVDTRTGTTVGALDLPVGDLGVRASRLHVLPCPGGLVVLGRAQGGTRLWRLNGRGR